MNFRWMAVVAGAGLALTAGAQQDLVVYDDALGSGWENWSWAAVDLAEATTIHSGTHSVRVTADGWEALYLHRTAMATAPYTSLSFRVHGGAAGGQPLQIQAMLSGNPQAAVGIGTAPTGSWRTVDVPLATLGIAGSSSFDGFWIQLAQAGSATAFYVDDIRLRAGTLQPPGTSTAVTVTLDALADRHPIDPRVYGVCFASSNQLRTLNIPLNRSGGNSATRYNWKTNATNRAADWYFQSLPETSTVPGASADEFVAASRTGGAEPMLTVPINGWVARLGAGASRLCSFSIAKYGAQTGNDWQWFPDAGNGIRSSNGQAITNNDPADANLAVGTAFQSEWIRHLTNRWGGAAGGGVRYYLMDNEWGLWHSTHRDTWPVGATMDQMRDRFCDYAAAVKDADHAALVVGPEEWGWTGYLYSGYDAQWGERNGWASLPDRAAHGGADFIPWWLAQVAARSQTAGRRLLDIFTLHFYPQGGEYSDDVSTAMQLRRNRSTRALWDTDYVDETWIADRVRLIPRMKEWVATNYPGTPVGITEYSWGADAHMNGATAQADILGILGREGADLATRWVVPGDGTPAAHAFRMYRNVDGTNGCFGDISLRAAAPDPDTLAAFGAERSEDGALTVMLVNKRIEEACTVTVALTNATLAGIARVWQLATNGIARLPDAAVVSNRVSLTVPPQSVTLLVAPGPPALTASRTVPGHRVEVRLRGEAGYPHVIQSSGDLSGWQPVATGSFPAAQGGVTVTPSGVRSYYRAVRAP